MTDPVVTTILFLATAPISFMPVIISILIRHPARRAILAGNAVVWGGVYLTAKHFATQSGFFLPIPVGVLCWIGLLAYVIQIAPCRAPLPAEAGAALLQD